MADRRLRVKIDVSDNFTGRMAAVAAAAREMHTAWTLRDATWEPHDWSEWS